MSKSPLLLFAYDLDAHEGRCPFFWFKMSGFSPNLPTFAILEKDKCMKRIAIGILLNLTVMLNMAFVSLIFLYNFSNS